MLAFSPNRPKYPTMRLRLSCHLTTGPRVPIVSVRLQRTSHLPCYHRCQPACRHNFRFWKKNTALASHYVLRPLTIDALLYNTPLSRRHTKFHLRPLCAGDIFRLLGPPAHPRIYARVTLGHKETARPARLCQEHKARIQPAPRAVLGRPAYSGCNVVVLGRDPNRWRRGPRAPDARCLH